MAMEAFGRPSESRYGEAVRGEDSFQRVESLTVRHFDRPEHLHAKQTHRERREPRPPRASHARDTAVLGPGRVGDGQRREACHGSRGV